MERRPNILGMRVGASRKSLRQPIKAVPVRSREMLIDWLIDFKAFAQHWLVGAQPPVEVLAEIVTVGKGMSLSDATGLRSVDIDECVISTHGISAEQDELLVRAIREAAGRRNIACQSVTAADVVRPFNEHIHSGLARDS